MDKFHDPQWWIEGFLEGYRCENGYTKDTFICKNRVAWHLHRDIWSQAIAAGRYDVDDNLILFANLCEEHYREWATPPQPEIDALNELKKALGLT